MPSDRPRTALVLLHAFPLNSMMWAPQAEALGEPYDLHMLDLPGFGEQPGLDQESLTMERAAEFVGREVESRGIERCVLGGLSMGGYVALECWRAFPERISGMILADTRAEADNAEALQGRYDAMERIGAGGYVQYCDVLLTRLLADETRESHPDLVDAVRAMMASIHPQHATASLLGMASRRDNSEILPGISVPTLILVGEHDTMTPPSAARAMSDAIPDATLKIIPRAAHLSNIENPNDFNDAVVRFMEKVEAQKV